MMPQEFQEKERRDFVRAEFSSLLGYKVCKKETVSKLLEGYTANISQSGLFCKLKERVNNNDILWLSFNRETLDFCKELEKRVLIYQNGIIANVTRVDAAEAGGYNVGVRFLTREEKDLGNIYSEAYFLNKNFQTGNG